MEKREIKFRYWTGEKMILPGNGSMVGFWDWYYYDQGNVLMQFTGLKDKNGREIYEGDVVLTSGFQSPISGEIDNTLFEVAYDGPWLVYKPVAGGMPESVEMIIGNRVDADEDAEVVGNVYQNPELCAKDRSHAEQPPQPASGEEAEAQRSGAEPGPTDAPK